MRFPDCFSATVMRLSRTMSVVGSDKTGDELFSDVFPSEAERTFYKVLLVMDLFYRSGDKNGLLIAAEYEMNL